ncbi:MAG: hypothetical protein RIS08_403 [Actinomycetota bacterium]
MSDDNLASVEPESNALNLEEGDGAAQDVKAKRPSRRSPRGKRSVDSEIQETNSSPLAEDSEKNIQEEPAPEQSAAIEEDPQESTDTLPPVVEEAQTRVKKIGVFARLHGYLRSLFRPKKVTAEAVAPEPELTVEEKQKLLDDKLARLNQEQKNAALFSQTAEQKQELIQEFDTRLTEVESWIQKLERSYFWKIQQRMDAALAQARSDISEYESLVRSLELPEKGTLRRLRETFHKGLMVTTALTLLPVAILYFIPWFARVDVVGWLSDALQSPWFVATVVLIAASVFGVRALLSKLLGKNKQQEKSSVWRRLRLPFVIAALPLLIFGLNRVKDWLLLVVVPVIEEIRPLTLLVLGILYIFSVLTLLVAYYRGWSIFRRQVTEEFSRLDNVVQGYVKTKQELARLEFLYRQTEEWLKILAHTLYRPWKIHPDWKTSNELQTSSESFPVALRVAQAVESDPAQTAQLQRLIARRLLTQGWRSQAFEKSLSRIGAALGYEESKISPELLDADLPHQPNNSRSLVLRYFEHSAQTASDGFLDLGDAFSRDANQRPAPSDIYLLDVARAQLSELIASTQGAALSEARPNVQQIVKNPLSDLGKSEFDSSDLIEVSNWDEFLSDSLGVAEVIQPPLGILSFSEEGLKAKSAESTESKILVPERFANSVPKANAKSVEVVAIPGSQAYKAAEIIVRIDVSGPLPFSHSALTQKASRHAKSQPVPIASPEEHNDDL